MLQGIVNPDKDGQFQIKVANTSKRNICLCAGKLLGHLYKATDTLRSAEDILGAEQNTFQKQATQLAMLVPNLDSLASSFHPDAPTATEYSDPEGTEHIGWGPKTTDPGPD